MAMIVQGFGRYESDWWPGDAGAPTRRQRAAGRFEQFVPDEIGALDASPELGLAAALSSVEASVARLDGLAQARAVRALMPLLSRQESIASSWIEGFEVGHRRLASAALDADERDVDARSVLGHVDALRLAVAIGARTAPFHMSDILEIHDALFARAPAPWPRMAGRLRSGVVWVGSGASTPVTAEFVGPPAIEVPALLEDLVAFMNRTDVPAIMQAAIAHAQFETIHPFPDGNGRVGRCLIHMLLSRSGLGSIVVPVSSVFASDPRGYVDGLTEYRKGEFGRWVEQFTDAMEVAAAMVAALEDGLGALLAAWRARIGDVRSDAADRKLLDALLVQPVLNVAAAMAAVGVSHQAAATALERLERREVVTGSGQKRHRTWVATEVIELMSAAERSFRRPAGGPPASGPAASSPTS
jgi:Fic family protein